MAYFMIKEGLELRREAKRFGIHVMPYYDVLYMLLSILIVGAIKETAIYFIHPLVNEKIEELYPKEVWPEKKRKSTYYTLGVFWYTISCAIGLWIFYGSDTVPRLFGGSGNNSATLGDFPENTVIPYSKFYMILQTGSHGYALFYHFYRKWNHPGFNELLLHHLVTIFILVHAYFTNGFAQSVVTLMFHDWGDWMYNFTTFYRDLYMHKYPNMVYLHILGFPFLFVYMRVIAQPIWYLKISLNWVLYNKEIYKHPQFYHFGHEIYYITSKL